MGNLVFQATLGGQVNLVGPNTASTFNINVPTVNGNMVTTGDTGTVTNTMCATSVYTAPGTIGSGTPNTGAFTTLTTTSTINNLTVGRGAGAISSNTAVGASALAGSNSGTGRNVAIGLSAMAANTSGQDNTAVGWQAMLSNTTGTTNTAVGRNALVTNTTGSSNTGIGLDALALNTTASNNTAVGYQAGYSNTTGAFNLFVGRLAGYSNTTAAAITAVGNAAAYANTTGTDTTAVGSNALPANTTGGYNTALGSQSLYSNTTASNNTAVGYQAGYTNSTGGECTFVGRQAGYASTGNYNTFFGSRAGYNSTGSQNTFIGGSNASTGSSGEAMTTGSKNTILGNFTGNQSGLDIRTLNNFIVLSDGDGNPRMYYNNSAATWAFSNLSSGAGTNALKWNTTTGYITYDTSSARYKDNIRDSIYGLSHVMQMRSTQFEYKDDGRSDVGFIAEELQPIIPELVGVNKEGQADSVSYDRMVSVLVKAVQELKAEFDAYKEAHP